MDGGITRCAEPLFTLIAIPRHSDDGGVLSTLLTASDVSRELLLWSCTILAHVCGTLALGVINGVTVFAKPLITFFAERFNCNCFITFSTILHVRRNNTFDFLLDWSGSYCRG